MTTVIRTLLAALCVGAALPAAATAAPTITEFSSGITSGGAPMSIAAGDDGNLWFTENGLTGRVARISPSGTVTEFSSGLTSGGGPFGITAGPDGNLWFTENALLGSIGTSSTAGSITRFTTGLTTLGELRHIAAGPDGNLWATWSANPGRIVRITPAGTITEFTTGLSVNSRPTGITAGPDGAMWFTENATPARIGRITTSGAITEHALPTPGSQPEQIVTGPDGNLWFTLQNGIGRITPEGVVTEFTSAITAGSRPSGIAVGGDGALWFASSTSPGRIGRITTAGVAAEYMTGLTPNSGPTGITRGPDGNMWFTQQLGDRIGRITVPPGVGATGAASIGTTTATVSASIRANSQATDVVVEYGPTSAYGSTTAPVAAGAGAGAVTVDVALTGLDPAARYHYRAVATNAAGVTEGAAAELTTAASPAIPGLPEPPADPAEVPAPEVGRSVVAEPLRGEVLIRLPGSAAPVPLGEASSLPVGAVIDARRGHVELISALDDGGRIQAATFWGGAFRIAQSPSARGRVDISLVGSNPTCGPPRPGVRRESARRRPGRSLWAKDDDGRYRTHGRNSVATVRGTTWFTKELCRGTLTRVVEGSVAVRDLAAGRTVIVRAGGRHLARRRR